MEEKENIKTVEVSFREDVYKDIVKQAEQLNLSPEQFISNIVSQSLLLPADPNSQEFVELNQQQQNQLTTVKKILQYTTGLWQKAADALAGEEEDI